jgi:hypothetical protein
MNKPVTGLVAGAVLGCIDGATAWLTPVARPLIQSILVGSSVKGMVVGLVLGFVARKVRSEAAIITGGAVLGLILAGLVASSPLSDGKYYWAEIMIPGFITGAIIGFLTQRYGQQ